MPSPATPEKRGCSHKSHYNSSTEYLENKRICTAASIAAAKTSQRAPTIERVLTISEDAVWSLRKSDLRSHFLILQKYSQSLSHVLPIVDSGGDTHDNSNETHVTGILPPLLRMPLEIRQLIYRHLLTPPSDDPRLGPHPRQLQSHIYLSSTFEVAVLHLNRQIYHEALPIFYGDPNQTISATVNYNLWAHKTQRSDLVLSSSLTSSIRNLSLSIQLGNEKRKLKPEDFEAGARVKEVTKGIKKLRKWLAGADIQFLKIGWQEPPHTYTWEQKKDILDGLKPLRARRVETGDINWGLDWNKGKKFRFDVEYLKELERARS
ncbi:hypothetical protein MFRU_019g00130 [Monilinia fructicola]|uniref:F-box domain-containing protein n=1 Tax=Monilinia fructicola TaxID=38448 RepID=A0A5M9JGX8_MONFR|nr:hypothetical protein EYC84_008943 [Monilinia fructicola]KAG4028719.1 hypothetical protein MFRU_019g00130 [Monilinia fructicola]